MPMSGSMFVGKGFVTDKAVLSHRPDSLLVQLCKRYRNPYGKVQEPSRSVAM
jgi:hypothetical protein